MSGRRSGSQPYSVTESKAVDRRCAGMPSETFLKRRLVRKASPSPANMRVGSSFSRLKAKTPAVYGKEPGTFSFMRKRRVSPSSSNFGSTTLRILVPDRLSETSPVRTSLSRILTTYSSPE
ncbi:MAG: hypothetical protein MOGDAGHF_01036 [Rhodocyclaceae bacterium]|nr:hypothetical protein [Rhodocyclaceae bacterium]